MIALVCTDDRWAIGKGNDLLFHIKDDMKEFKKTTTNGIVVMGRKTWESLPKRPLPNRVNLIITTQDLKDDPENDTYYTKIEDVMDAIHFLQNDYDISDYKTFLIGGEQLYFTLINKCSTAIITRVHTVVPDADKFFPNLDKSHSWVTRLYSDPSKVSPELEGITYDTLRYYNINHE